MVHLNPCRVSWQGEELTLSYIVAVATEEAYRGQGIMGKLLGMALEEMDRRGEPFTFLMPAAEAIYTPYGFRRPGPGAGRRMRRRQEKSGQSSRLKNVRMKRWGSFPGG